MRRLRPSPNAMAFAGILAIMALVILYSLMTLGNSVSQILSNVGNSAPTDTLRP